MAELQQPTYSGNTRQDAVTVPALQSLVLCVIVAFSSFFSILLIWWIGKDIPPIAPVVNAVLGGWWFKIAVAAGVISFFITALVEWPKRREYWTWWLEMQVHRDFDGDGAIGPAPRGVPLKVMVTDGNNGTFDELPYAERLPALARGLKGGKPFTFAAWAGGPAALFSQPEWGKLTSELLAQGYIEYNNPAAPNKGYRFTQKGNGLLDSLLQDGSRVEVEAKEEMVFASTSPTAPYWH